MLILQNVPRNGKFPSCAFGTANSCNKTFIMSPTVQKAQNRNLKVLHAEVEWWPQFSEDFAEI